jgi:hypothetical protein
MPPGEKALTSLFTSLQHIMSSISLQLLFFFFFLVYRTSLKHSRELSICHFAGFLLSQPEIQMIQFAFKEKSSMFLLLLQLLFLENMLLVATTHIGKIFDRNLGNIRCLSIWRLSQRMEKCSRIVLPVTNNWQISSRYKHCLKQWVWQSQFEYFRISAVNCKYRKLHKYFECTVVT